MSPWDEGDWPGASRKQPAPVRGIRIGRTGTTWWGQRWLGALERLSREYGTRLARGKSYARAGRAHDLTVDAGVVSAQVTGSSVTPYDVRLTVPILADDHWAAAIAAMARRAGIAADLLAGQMPRDIDDAFAAAGTSLFPERAVDLAVHCSCPDWASPCKHAAAVHYVLGDAFDRDPFLLFELRGRSRREVLDALRRARAGGHDAAAEPAQKGPAQVPTVRLPRMRADRYDALRAPLPLGPRRSDPLPSLPGAGSAVIRQLGAPPGWSGKATPEDVFGAAVHLAATWAATVRASEE